MTAVADKKATAEKQTAEKQTVGGAEAVGRTGSAPAGAGRGRTAADRAYQRRARRQEQITGPRLTRSGRPIQAALTRVPFVLVVIAALAAGVIGVLWLQTLTDEAGLRASASRQSQAELNLQIESLKRDVAGLDAIPRIDQQARAMGMVPVGDPAILSVGADGQVTLLGTPTPVRAPAPAPPAVTPAPAPPAVTPAAAATATSPVPAAASAPAAATGSPTTPAAAPARPPAASARVATTPAPASASPRIAPTPIRPSAGPAPASAGAAPRASSDPIRPSAAPAGVPSAAAVPSLATTPRTR